MDSRFEKKNRLTNDSPLVNPLSIILVKNGSKGDRLLFRYPFKQQSIGTNKSTQKPMYESAIIGSIDNIPTPTTIQLQLSPSQQMKFSSRYPSATSIGNHIKSPLAKSSPIVAGQVKNPYAITSSATSLKSVKNIGGIDVVEEVEYSVESPNISSSNNTANTSTSSLASLTTTGTLSSNKLTPLPPLITSTPAININPQTHSTKYFKKTTHLNKDTSANDILSELTDKDLSNLLSVPSELAEKKFELKINQVRFVGHPTLMQHPNMKEFYTNTMNQQTTTIKIFHIVFCVKAMASHSVVKCFYDLSKRLGVGLRHEEYRCNYVSTELRKIVAMLDEVSHHEVNLGGGGGIGEHDNIMEDNYFEHLASEILAKSSLAQLLKQVYDDVCNTGFVKLKVNHWVQISFCLPQKIHVLPYRNPPPIVEPENIHKCLEAIRPYHALLLLIDREELVASFGVDATSTIPRLLQVYSPLKSLQTIAADADLTLGHVVEIASHLVYWAMATIIYPICETNVYVVAPDAPVTSYEMDEAFLDRFPGLSLSQTMSDFSMPSQLGELINPVLGGSYVQSQVVQLVCWLLQNHLLIQLHTYIYMLTYLDSSMNLNATGGGCTDNDGQYILDGNLSLCPPYYVDPEEDEITVSDSYSETTGDDVGMSSPIPPPLQASATATTLQAPESIGRVPLLGNSGTGNDVVDGVSTINSKKITTSLEEGATNNNSAPMEKLKGTLDELTDPVRRALLLVKQPISIQDIKIFSKISKYFNGEYHLEEIMYMENMRRSQVLLVLDKFRDVLITVEKEDADINFFCNHE